METIISQPLIDEKHEDSFWYDGLIAEVSEGLKKINIYAEGDVRIDYDNRNIYAPEDLTDEEYELGDSLLWDYHEDLTWINNNWFDFYFEYDGEPIEVDVDVEYSYTDALKIAQKMLFQDDFWEEGQ